MAITDFSVGEGHLALAFGQHIVAGILAGIDKTDLSNIKIKLLLGVGEWNAIKEASYDGTVLSPSTYTFHPGTLSTGAADPLQGQDSRFPNSIYHNRTAYLTATLPGGLGAEDRPDKTRIIAECLKMWSYDEAGHQVAYAYSTNPADAFVEVIRRNNIRLGLPLVDSVDWGAYAEARELYRNTILIDDWKRTPRNPLALNFAGGGTLATGTWYYKVIAVGAGSDKSTGSDVRAVGTVLGSHNTVTWDEVDDPSVTGYRIYFSKDDPNGFTKYFSVSGASTTSFDHTTISGASTGTPPTLPTGSWSVSAEEFQCHRAFTQSEILTGDALSAIMFDAASEWVKDGSRYRILLPNRSSIAHTFTVENTTSANLQISKVPPRDRKNRVTANFRNLDKTMQPDTISPANDFALQGRVGINEEEITLGSKNTSEARRITKWWRKYRHAKPRFGTITGQGDSAHVLVGDLVNVIDRQMGTRSLHGAVPNDGLIVSSLINRTPVLSSPGIADWNQEVPTPLAKSQAFQFTGEGLSTFTLASPVAVGANSSIALNVRVEDDSVAEIIVSLTDNTSATYSGSFRRPQTASGAPGTVVRLGSPPNRGGWVPIRVWLDDLSIPLGRTITSVKVGIITEATQQFLTGGGVQLTGGGQDLFVLS
jgi:hypothetical protein